MDNNIAIRVENLTKIYPIYEDKKDRMKEALSPTRRKYHKEFKALSEISFEIHKGETLGIIGRNGSGKSTLLKILTGVLSPTKGMFSVKGKISALLELGAGFNSEMTGMENIYLNGTIMGYTKEEMDERVPKITEFADIGDFIDQPVKMYSSGMFARLAFAVAINVAPDILIVDEALSVGDVFFQTKCYKKFDEFKELGKTILFVTHDMSSINKYCDRAVLIDRGHMVDIGNSKEIIDLYKKLLVNQLGNYTINATEYIAEGQWKQQININPNKVEYGNHSATIIDFAIVDKRDKVSSKIEKGDPFSIKMKVRFNAKITEPIFAFTIKDMKGNEITGTNTMIEKNVIPHVEAEEVKDVIFTQNLDLQGGEYLLSLGCTGFQGDEFIVYHRLYDVCSISVISEKNTIGFFDANSTIEII